MLAVISANATIMTIIFRDIWVDFIVIDYYVKLFIGNMNRITIR
jgi:hypothetical protein